MHPKIHTKVFLTNEYWDSILVRSEVVGSYMVILMSNSHKDVLLLINWWKGEIIKASHILLCPSDCSPLNFVKEGRGSYQDVRCLCLPYS